MVWVTVACRCLFFESRDGRRLSCLLSLTLLSIVPVVVPVLVLGASWTQSGTVMPLSVANLGSRRRNRQIKLRCWPSRLLCVPLLTFLTLILLIIMCLVLVLLSLLT